MVGVGPRQVADQCQQRPLVALHEAAERLDVCRQHPPDRIEVVVHGALPCGTEPPLRGYTAGPGKSSPGLEGPRSIHKRLNHTVVGGYVARAGPARPWRAE